MMDKLRDIVAALMVAGLVIICVLFVVGGVALLGYYVVDTVKTIVTAETHNRKRPDVPGQKAAFSNSTCVYLYVGDEDWDHGPPLGAAVEGKKSISFVPVTADQATNVVLRDAKCVVSAGMEVQDLRLAAYTETFAIADWKDADADGSVVIQRAGVHRAKGIRISVKGILKIHDTCPEGHYSVYLELPGLAALAEATGTEPRRPYVSGRFYRLLLSEGNVSRRKVDEDGE